MGQVKISIVGKSNNEDGTVTITVSGDGAQAALETATEISVEVADEVATANVQEATATEAATNATAATGNDDDQA